MNKKFKQRMKHVSTILLLLAVCLLFTGCASSEWVYDPITDVNNLEGRRVGVNLAWESDYYLDGRKDMELVRYDTTSDMIMALKYDKIDAIALDIDTLKLIFCVSDGIELIEPAFGEVGSIMYFGSDDESLKEEFNQYLDEFKKTDEYEDLLNRMDEYNGFEFFDADIPLTGEGKTIHVAVDPEEYPRAFLYPGEDIPVGYDLEILKHFANDNNYQLEFYFSTYLDSLMGLQTGSYDIMTGYLSDVYAPEVRRAGLYTCEPMYEFPLYFIQKNSEDMTSDMGELE